MSGPAFGAGPVSPDEPTSEATGDRCDDCGTVALPVTRHPGAVYLCAYCGARLAVSRESTGIYPQAVEAFRNHKRPWKADS